MSVVNRMLFSLLVAGLMVLPAPTQAHGQSSTSAQPPTGQVQAPASGQKASQLSREDRLFAIRAALDGQGEVQLGKVAEQKASDPSVKQFAEKMVTDHTQANQKLAVVASQKGVTLPTRAAVKDRVFLKHVESLSGAAFDKAYMNHIVLDHNQDVAGFKAEASKVKDADLKAWIDSTLPTLQEHDNMAKKIDQKIGGTAASAPAHHPPRTKKTESRGFSIAI